MASEVTLDPYQPVHSGSPQQLSDAGKKSWEEIRKSVRDSVKQLSVLGSSTPSSFTFRATDSRSSNPRSRLYFLGVPEKGRENTLLYVDVVDDGQSTPSLVWTPLLDTVHTSIQVSFSG